MHATTAGKVTCASPWPCSQPGTVPVVYVLPPTYTPRAGGDGEKITEHVVTLECCERCASRLDHQRPEG